AWARSSAPSAGSAIGAGPRPRTWLHPPGPWSDGAAAPPRGGAPARGATPVRRRAVASPPTVDGASWQLDEGDEVVPGRIALQRQGPLDEVLPLALHMCSALHYLAAEEVVHLDVKPLNIIMGPQPRLIDLSLARTVAQASGMTGPVGTTAYMAPEQCRPGQAG